MQNINVSIIPEGVPQFVRYSQNDIGREFKINVVDFDIPSGATVECVATKPSGLGFTVSGTVTDNTVTFVTTAIMTDEWGKFPAELRISSGGEVLGTANFMFIGERNPHPEGTTDGQQGTIIPELTLLVNEIRESNARVAEMTASAHTSDVPTAEYDAETNNLEFGIPSIPEEEFLKAFVTDSASGSIASITDGGDGLPVKSLNVSIVPKQSGSGDPSPTNVRPISGWSGVNVEVRGLNLLDGEIEQGGISATTGANIDATSNTRTKNYSVVKPSTSYYYQKDTSDYGFYLSTYDKDKRIVRFIDGNGPGGVLTTQADEYYIRARFNTGDVTAIETTNLMVTKGTSRATAYEPYQGTSYPIPLPSTVYGGELNVVSGEGVSDMSTPIDLGDLTWRRGSNSGVYYFYATLPTPCAYSYNTPLEQLKVTALSYAYKGTVGWAYMGNKTFGFTRDTLRIRDDSYTDADTFKASLMDIDFSYGIAEPQTFQTTPTPINTLLGSNNIYSDSGSVEVEYRADTKLYIDKLLGNTRTLSMAMAPAPEETTTEEEPAEEEQR